MDAPEHSREYRRFERTTVLWSGQLVYQEQSVACVIVNISSGGAMVRSEDSAMFVTSLVLRSSRIGDLAAKVAWRQDDEIGLKFSDDPEIVAEALGRALK